jgi:hypothetical protein
MPAAHVGGAVAGGRAGRLTGRGRPGYSFLSLARSSAAISFSACRI